MLKIFFVEFYYTRLKYSKRTLIYEVAPRLEQRYGYNYIFVNRNRCF